MLPIELANQQWGYVVLAVLSICFLIITMIQVLAQKEPKYGSVISYGVILVCVGIASVIFNIQIIDVSLNSFGGGLLAQSMALMFSIAMAVWAIFIVVIALHFANRLKIFNKQNMIQVYLVLVPIILVMMLVVQFVNIDSYNESVALLRETIFLVVPVITVTSCAISMFARKIVER